MEKWFPVRVRLGDKIIFKGGVLEGIKTVFNMWLNMPMYFYNKTQAHSSQEEGKYTKHKSDIIIEKINLIILFSYFSNLPVML